MYEISRSRFAVNHSRRANVHAAFEVLLALHARGFADGHGFHPGRSFQRAVDRQLAATQSLVEAKVRCESHKLANGTNKAAGGFDNQASWWRFTSGPAAHAHSRATVGRTGRQARSSRSPIGFGTGGALLYHRARGRQTVDAENSLL